MKLNPKKKKKTIFKLVQKPKTPVCFLFSYRLFSATKHKEGDREGVEHMKTTNGEIGDSNV